MKMRPVLFRKNGWTWLLAGMLLASCHVPRKTSSVQTAVPNARAYFPGKSSPNISSGELKKKYAAVLNTSVKELRNADLYRFIDEWQGVPYQWGGNDKNGVDCSGFVCRLYETVYHKKLERTVAAQFAGAARDRNLKKLKEGDLVYFKTGSRTDHVGVYLNNGFFAHASVKSGVIISSLFEPYWKQAYVAALREAGRK